MSIYLSLKELIVQYIYGNNVQTGSFEELVTILIATIGCLFIVALPFLVVKKIIDLL